MKTLRFLSLIAVSSAPQAEKESPEEQRRLNTEFVQNLSNYYPGYAGFITQTISIVGTRTIIELSDACRLHEGYRQLVDAIKGRTIDAIVCRSRDRIARMDALILTIERLCNQHDIIVVPRQSLPVTIDINAIRNSEGAGLISVIEGHFARSAVQRLVHENQMGMQARVRQRKLFPSNVPWGYKYVYSEDGQQSIQVDTNAAPAIRALLVDLFVGKRLAYRQIAEILNRSNLPSPNGPWSERTVRHIVANADRFAGYLTLNVRSKTGRDVIHVPGDHQAIISEEELAFVRLEKKTRKFGRTPRGGSLSGSIYCSVADLPLVAEKQHYKTSKGAVVYKRMRCLHCIPQHSILEKSLIAYIKEFLAQVQGHSDLDTVTTSGTQREKESIEANISAMLGRLEDIARKKQRLLSVFVEREDIDPELFDKEMDSLSRQASGVESSIERLRTELENSLSAEMEAAKVQRMAEMKDELLKLMDENPAIAQRFLIETIRVFVSPTPDGSVIDRIVIV